MNLITEREIDVSFYGVHLNSFVLCPFCGLYDAGYGDSCALIAGLHPEFEQMAASHQLCQDFSDDELRGWDFIAFYGQPVSLVEELSWHMPERN